MKVLSNIRVRSGTVGLVCQFCILLENLKEISEYSLVEKSVVVYN
jgi:hypothetical protein